MTLLRDFPRETLAETFAVVAAFAIFYLTTTFTLGYATTTLAYDRREFLAVLRPRRRMFLVHGVFWQLCHELGDPYFVVSPLYQEALTVIDD